MSDNTQNNIIIYQSEEGLTKINVNLQEETVWLSQQQMAELYQTSRTNVVEHIRHIYQEGELTEDSTCRNFRQVQTEGNREVSREIPFYNLDMIISLGYRVKSSVATRFRIWATKLLNEYIRKGFALDDNRLKNLGGGGYWKELIERIRDIRSSEKVFYRQVLDNILTMSGEKLLQGAGKVSHQQAIEHATNEYKKYQQCTLSQVEKDFLDNIKALPTK